MQNKLEYENQFEIHGNPVLIKKYFLFCCFQDSFAREWICMHRFLCICIFNDLLLPIYWIAGTWIHFRYWIFSAHSFLTVLNVSRVQQLSFWRVQKGLNKLSFNCVTFVTEYLWLILILKLSVTHLRQMFGRLVCCYLLFFKSLDSFDPPSTAWTKHSQLDQWCLYKSALKAPVFWTRYLNLKDTFITSARFRKASLLLTPSCGSGNWSKW